MSTAFWPTTPEFLSTPSARRATARSLARTARTIISIHALREEGDQEALAGKGISNQFLSTPSARRATCQPESGRCPAGRFLSTPSARRATPCQLQQPPQVVIFLSTPSARRATLQRLRRNDQAAHFYPRPPRGGRREFQNPEIRAEYISIHALREEGDHPSLCIQCTASADFYPRPPRGGRRAKSIR